MLFKMNEGLNDRFDGQYTANRNIITDIKIDNILNNTPPERIWFGTDWHLWQWDKKEHTIKKNPKFNEFFFKQKDKVKPDDVFIYLGDLSDDECQNYDELAKALKGNLNGYKILILGNNDLQPESYYLNDCGFDAVFFAYQWNKFTFSHIPLEKRDTPYNIHGHFHQYWDYPYNNITWNNMLKLYTGDFNNEPISLKKVIDLWNSGYFVKNIKK
jgi:calcineurin-like phosphoesterase family protein